MFAKIAVLIMALGAFAAGLLSLRQSRLQVASELTQSQLRINESDEQLWRLRTKIAGAVTPQAVEELAKDAGPLRPLALPPLATMPEAEGKGTKTATQEKPQKPGAAKDRRADSAGTTGTQR